MIKKMLHKTFAMLLACLVLFSTVSFTVDKHFCGDVLVDVSIFTKAEGCCAGMPSSKAHHANKKSCCKDEIALVIGQKLLKTSSFDEIHFEKKPFIASLHYAYIEALDLFTKDELAFINYSPPNTVSDIHVLNKVFII